MNKNLRDYLKRKDKVHLCNRCVEEECPVSHEFDEPEHIEGNVAIDFFQDKPPLVAHTVLECGRFKKKVREKTCQKF